LRRRRQSQRSRAAPRPRPLSAVTAIPRNLVDCLQNRQAVVDQRLVGSTPAPLRPQAVRTPLRQSALSRSERAYLSPSAIGSGNTVDTRSGSSCARARLP
jgi:hypothetical protein